MKRITLLLIILLTSCEAPNVGVNESDADTFEKNVQTLRDGFISGYEVEDFDKVISIFADSIKYYPSGVDAQVVSGIDQMKENIALNNLLINLTLKV